jgi:hypothetical protein
LKTNFEPGVEAEEMRDGSMVSQAKMMLMSEAFTNPTKRTDPQIFQNPRSNLQKSGSQINEEKKYIISL